MTERIKRFIDNVLEKYKWLISLLLKLNFVKVSRERYVREVLSQLHDKDDAVLLQKALATSLADVLTTEEQHRIYVRMIWKYGAMVFLASFLLTLSPENMLFTILFGVLDLVVFQSILFIAMQKILLLYGRHCDMEKEEEKSAMMILSIDSSGLMIGKHTILQKMKSVVGWLGKQIVKRVGPKLISKVAQPLFVVMRRQAVKWFSIIIAKEHVSLALEALIPLTCALISGLVSTIIFVPMCNKLRKHLIIENEKRGTAA